MALEPGLTEIATTTARLRSKILKDNITNNNAVLLSMKEHDGLVAEPGGRSIIEEVWFDQNQTVDWYNGTDPISTASSAVITAAEYDWKQLGGSVVMSGRDQRMNSGTEAVIKLMTGRFTALEQTLENLLNTGILSDGTGSGGKQIIGLASLVSKVPTTGSPGGIDRSLAANAWWRNFKLQPTVDIVGGTVTSVANIKSYYNRVINRVTRGTDKPTLILAGDTHYEALQGALQALQIVQQSKMADAGFQTLSYMGIPVVLGGGVSYSGAALVQSDLSYFLNTKYLKLRYHKDANFEPLSKVQSINQDTIVQLIVWMGALTLSNARLQGVLFDT